MGNKPNKPNVDGQESNQAVQRNKQNIQNTRKSNKKQEKKKQPSSAGGGCFGTKKTKTQTNRKPTTQASSKSKIKQTYDRSAYAHETRKSSIFVKNQPEAKVDEKLFADRERSRLEIKMRRAEPYEILKDSDYFDSEINDKSDLERLRKVYDTCEIANYQTPETQKLQTVQIKTYLFDRNLTKIEA